MRPFEARPEEIESNLDHFVDMVFASLASGFMVMPRGSGFVDYATFEQGYEVVKRNTQAFSDVSATSLLSAVMEMQVSLIVIRTILGFTPPEWAYITTQTQGAEVSQSFARSLDRKVRVNPLQPLKNSERITLRVNAMLAAAAQFMREAPKRQRATICTGWTRQTHVRVFVVFALRRVWVCLMRCFCMSGFSDVPSRVIGTR